VSVHWRRRDGARELHISAATPALVFEATTQAFGELIPATEDGVPDRLPVLVRATEPAALIGAFVDDLLYLAEVECFAAVRLERVLIDGRALRAAVSGWSGAAQPLVTCVLSSEFGYDPASGAWRATLVLA
jgi:hypothetical protein